MEKRISTTQLRAAKRVATTVEANLAKRKKAEAQIKKWTDEFNHQENVIRNYEAGLIADIGLRSEQIVTKVLEPTGKFYKNGRELKRPKYIINDNVRFDSDTKEYVVTINDEGNKEVAPVKDENDNEGAPVEDVTAEQPVEELPEELNDLTAQAVESEPAEAMQEEPAFEEMFGH